MRTPAGMLIDLDDTLLCFDGVSRESWVEACTILDHPAVATGVLVDEIWAYSHWYYSDPDRHREGRNRLEETRRMVVREAFGKLGIDDPKIAADIADRYSRIRDEKLFLFPRVHETLDELRSRGIPLCLVTNGESHLQRRKIERFGLEPHFDGVLIEGECGYGKPDERIFRDALEVIKAPAEAAWIVGDNLEWEVIAPKRLGFTCVWRDKRGTGLPEGLPVTPDAIIDQFSEVSDLIESSVLA